MLLWGFLAALGMTLQLSALPIALVDDWIAAPSEGVTLDISREGTAMRLDFDFHGGAGYAIARKKIALDLPDDYEFTFNIRGDTPPNTLEFKLIDETGENVWWVNNRNYRFPREWTRMRIKKRHLEFAWGPGGAEKPLKKISAMEIVITASTGGKGTVWIDDLQFSPRDPAASEPIGNVTWSSTSPFTADLGARREFGGLTIDWDKRAAAAYVVELSDDGAKWEKAYEVTRGNGGTDPIFMPDSDARFIRVRVTSPGDVDVPRIAIEPLAFSSSRNAFFATLAARDVAGLFPKYLRNEQSYWTIVGIPGSEREALLSDDGAIEVDRSSFSIEPFIFRDGKLVTWSDVTRTHSLAGGDLPVPSVTWTAPDLRLVITAVAVPGDSTLYAQYDVTSSRPVSVFLAMRPFQVNPPWQFLNVPGGWAETHSISYDGVVRADEHRVVPLTKASGFGAAAFDSGEIHEYLARGELPSAQKVSDSFGAASGALRYEVAGRRTILIALPEGGGEPPHSFERRQAAALRWGELLSRFSLELPPVAAHVARTVKSNVAYILINQDGAAIQPGSRSYDRSWIRDGSLTSAALLRLGYAEEARSFVEWFAKYQFPTGKIPCCVDSRGADPVNEHDSSGEFIYAVAEVYRHTGDRAFLTRMWPHVDAAVKYVESLLEKKPEFYGLMPESISHEGYSAKPMHSYWDDFFTLRGLKDAVFIANNLGKDASHYERLRDEFDRNLIASIDKAMRAHNIDYIPGCVELGDFDATSTTIALNPVNADVPRHALQATFDRYYDEFARRRDGQMQWDIFTPYENRVIGTFVRLGQRERAHELLSWFMSYLRPAKWNQWSEAVWRDPKTPKFIGDMPHTWVGSDFIRSVLDMFAYETDDDQLIVGAGLPLEWIASGEGVRMHGLHTHHGVLNMSAHGTARSITFEFSGSASPPSGFVLQPPRAAAIKSVVVDGQPGELAFKKMPKRVVVNY